MISFATNNNGTYPTPGSLASALSTYGFTPSPNDTVNLISASNTGVCISAQITGGTQFYITDKTGVSTAACS